MRLSDLDARGSGRGGHIAAVALFAIVILVVLFLVVFGASIYRFAVVTSEADDALRATQGYVGTHVQAADEQDAISIGQGPEGTALVITEAGDTAAYEVRIYAYEGVLVEEYARAGSSYDPETAQRIAQCPGFEVSWASSAGDGQRLLQVTCGSNTAYYALKSASEVG